MRFASKSLPWGMRNNLVIKKRKRKNIEHNDDDDFSFEDLFGFDVDGDKVVQRETFFSNVFTINLDREIGSPNEYRSAFHILRQASQYDVINVVLNTEGGFVNTTMQFVNYLLNTPARTMAEVHSAYSAGAIVALACDEVYVARFGSMMIHSLTTESFGKTHELDQHLHFINKYSHEIIRKAFIDFLTPKEIQSVIKGKDIWLYEEEIQKRLEHWTPIRKRKTENKNEEKQLPVNTRRKNGNGENGGSGYNAQL